MSDQTTAVDIDGMVNGLLDRLDNTETDAELVAGLHQQAWMVRVIANACERTTLFRRSAEQYATFKAELEQDHPAEERLLAAWLHFLDRVVNAPTRLHCIGAVRLCLPLVALYLPQATTLWRCDPCGLEHPIERPCDVCGQATREAQ